MAEDRRDRSGRAQERAFKAGFAAALEIGKTEAENTRMLVEQIRRESLKQAEAAFKTFLTTEKPRRARRAKDEKPTEGGS